MSAFGSGGCPHRNIVFCPLYHAAHEVELLPFTCCTGDIEAGCSVARGEERYAELVAKLSVADPRLVEILRFQEQAMAAREQRDRNLAVNGIH